MQLLEKRIHLPTFSKENKRYHFAKNPEFALLLETLRFNQCNVFPESFCYVDLSQDRGMENALCELYPDMTYVCCSVEEFLTLTPQNVYFLYLGETLSFLGPDLRHSLFSHINKILCPGGYVVAPYEAKVGWGKYSAVLDVLRDQAPNESLHSWLDYQQNVLCSFEHLIPSWGKLDRFFNYLKSLTSKELFQILKAPSCTFFYPNTIKQLLEENDWNFIGTLPLDRNYFDLGLSPQQQSFLKAQHSFFQKTHTFDLFTDPLHRIDVWKKGEGEGNTLQFSDYVFGSLSSSFSNQKEITIRNATFSMEGDFFVALKDKLATSFDSVQTIAVTLDKDPNQILNAITILLISNKLLFSRFSKQLTNEKSQRSIEKIKFRSKYNYDIFTDIYTCMKTGALLLIDRLNILVPLEQPLAMLLAALTQMNSETAIYYCAELFSKEGVSSSEDAEKEFRHLMKKLHHEYLQKWVDLGIIDSVLE